MCLFAQTGFTLADVARIVVLPGKPALWDGRALEVVPEACEAADIEQPGARLLQALLDD